MSIEDLIDDITNQNFAKAEPHFHTILQSKVNDALEAEKVKVAGHIFNGEEEEQLELDLEDEDEEEVDVDEADADEEVESEEEEEVEEET
tara:strand:- start:119 stop:388 length:270 start_codon:yes stop_codon:yes gene_type:complete